LQHTVLRLFNIGTVCMFPRLETLPRNDQIVEPHLIDAASLTTSETNVTFDAHGVNFYLRLGAIGTVAAMAMVRDE